MIVRSNPGLLINLKKSEVRSFFQIYGLDYIRNIPWAFRLMKTSWWNLCAYEAVQWCAWSSQSVLGPRGNSTQPNHIPSLYSERRLMPSSGRWYFEHNKTSIRCTSAYKQSSLNFTVATETFFWPCYTPRAIPPRLPIPSFSVCKLLFVAVAPFILFRSSGSIRVCSI